jgi:tetratricopeptide (TPR) repeat protein
MVFFLAFGLLRRGGLPQRTWFYVTVVAFFLSAFLQPTLDGARIDLSGWWLQRPFHTYTQFAFALVVFLGAGCLYGWLAQRRAGWMRPLAWASLLLLAWPAWMNHDRSTQRGHWWGWLYGREMLAELPTGAVIFGGTDPGRFVPTWMILGESNVPPKWKRDGDFDRRDLYIITQNALVDPLYLRYIRDHYSAERPEVRSRFERWLGREEAYPSKPLTLPDEEVLRGEIEKILEEGKDELAAHGAVAKWIFEKNKGEHAFYVEESFPMEWTYEQGWPEGFLIRLSPEEVKEISSEIVARDFAFWDEWIRRWDKEPTFLRDYDARRSFAKLRIGQANLYRHREMKGEAARAYRQALQIDASQVEALLPLSSLEWEENRFDEVSQRWKLATQLDPNNDYLWVLRAVAERRKTRQEEAAALEQKLAEQPEDLAGWQELATLWVELVEKDKAVEVLQRAGKALPENAELRQFAMGLFWQVGEKDRAREMAHELTRLQPNDFQSWLARAALEMRLGDEAAAEQSVIKAIELNEIGARREIRQSPVLRPVLQDPDFLGKKGGIETP